MPNLERKLPKFAAPLVLTAAAIGFSACSKDEPKQPGPDIPPTPTMSGGVITEARPEASAITSIPETSTNTALVNHNGYDYELYTNVTIDDMIKTAELLPDFNINETVVNKLQGIKTSLQIDPTDPRVVPSLNQIINIADANCQDDIENSRELIRKVVSWVQENQPDYIEGTLKLATQGPCSVAGETQVVAVQTTEIEKGKSKITQLEPWTNRYSNSVHTVIKEDYAYTYSLISIPDIEYALTSVIGLIQDPKLLAYITDPNTRKSIVDKYQKAKDMEDSNPNNPNIPEQLLEATEELSKACTTKFHGWVVRGRCFRNLRKRSKFLATISIRNY